ncbi:MAG: hypothetical protein J7604_11430 [Sporocytophaga sp.]|uniref:hypothetical protein n=1 Tax=Sporocytophaga sp. TaxID=2231183 RepID=UPI001B1D63A8|nr:hypothetical protein [Sporocytophaga sp.]MBO9700812.1 hypothetical protein [Sporocytophaga sp.]
MKRKEYMLIGVICLMLYFIQHIADLRWSYLWELQQNETFKRLSGLGLMLFVCFQWVLAIVRVNKKVSSVSMKSIYKLHKWLGALSPIFFYIHSMKLGFAYLFFLSIVFFSNILLGFANSEIVKNQPKWFYNIWMITHVFLSLTISSLALYHIWIVFYFE